MTDNDHTDALHGDAIGALRSPALPFERVHEAAVLSDMEDALTTAPLPSSVRRHRRLVAFAAVTVASLGVGGLVAAGPGGFRPFDNDDKPPATPVFDDSVLVPAPDGADTDDIDDEDDGGGTERITTDPDFECAEGEGANHGQTVSSAAQAPGPNSAAAHSECGKPVGSGAANDNRDDNRDVNRDANENDAIPGPPASTPGNPDPGPPPSDENGNQSDIVNGSDTNVDVANPGPPASTPGNPNSVPPVNTGNGHGTSTTTQPAG